MIPDPQEKEDAAVLALMANALRARSGEITETEIASVLGGGCTLSEEGRAALEDLGELDLDSQRQAVSRPMCTATLVFAIHRENTNAELDEATKKSLADNRKEVLDRVARRRQTPPP